MIILPHIQHFTVSDNDDDNVIVCTFGAYLSPNSVYHNKDIHCEHCAMSG